jgi:hypothetical protein
VRLTRIVVVSLLAIVATFTLACGSSSGQNPASTPTSTATYASTPTPTPTPEFTTYTNESFGFSMSVPSYWDQPEIGSETALFTAPLICRGGGVVATVVTAKSTISSLQTNWRTTKAVLEDMDDYDLVSEDDITMSGIAAKELVSPAHPAVYPFK